MNEERCKLCNRAYEYDKYKLFGRGCLTNLYDYTDFKNLKEYLTATNSVPKSLFSSTLNNFAVASSEYGVIRPYEFTMKFEIKNYVVSEEE